jgi:hypothetical protein
MHQNSIKGIIKKNIHKKPLNYLLLINIYITY